MAAHRFGEFELDVGTRQVVRDGAPVHLSPKAFRLLQILTEAAPRALSKDELQGQLWPETFVVEANLHHLVGEIRAALGESSRTPRFVRTVHGFGYAFQAPVAEAGRQLRRSPVRLPRWDGGRARLTEGEHLIGRGPDADVVLDFGSVSRSHARISVAPAAVMLKDAGSKNGSFVGGTRVKTSTRLTDGDEITIGSVSVSVRILTGVVSTETAVLEAPPRL